MLTSGSRHSHRSLLKCKHKWAKKLKGWFNKKKSGNSIQPSTPSASDNVDSTDTKHHTILEGRTSSLFPSASVNIPVDEVPLHASSQGIPPNQPGTSKLATSDVDLEAGIGAVNDTDSPVHLRSLIDSLYRFKSIVDKIPAIHPYAHAAWSVLNSSSKAIIEHANRADFISPLLLKMDDVYTFLVQKDLLGIESMKLVVERVCHQTLECIYFIREHSQNTKFRARLYHNFIPGMTERIQNYNAAFDELMQQFRDKTNCDTSVVVYRIWESPEDTAQNSDLNIIPYVDGAGLDRQKLCLEGTRHEILDEITTWINSAEENTPRIFWLNGSAGSGKSSIAHTIADRFEKLGRLGSCYCFDRYEIAQQRHKRVLTTLARDLAHLDEQMGKMVARAIHQDTSLKHTSDILQQWDELIMKPAMAFSEAIAGPIVIIIDALDEAGDPKSRARFLRILAGKLGDEESHITKLPPHFRILVTSRPLPDIYNVFNDIEHIQSKLMDSIPPLATKRDIHLYISRQLADLKGIEIQRASADLSSASGGLFEWARLACAFIKNEDDDGRTVQELFDAVMTHNKDVRVPLLDGMYLLTLETIFPEGTSQRSVRLSRFRSVMAQIIETVEPLPLAALGSIRHYFADKKLQEIDVKIIINSLGALLSGTTDPSAVVRPLHASFPEFLQDESRSREFFVNSSHIDNDLAIACLGVMENELQFNMCKLPSSYLPNSEIPDLIERIKENISPALSYSSRFWAHHLRHTQFNLTLAEIVRNFLNHERLLFWLEAMSLLKKVSTCISLFSDIIRWVMPCADCDDIVDIARDMQRFIRVFGVPISFSTPHLYVSAIPFSPTNSHISKTFSDRFGNALRIVRGHDVDWPIIRAVLHGHLDVVHSVSFSPDGKHIVSGSKDKTIRLWDAEIGEIVRPPLEGHEDEVFSVAFTPDGKYIVSGSYDGTIRLWDVETGELLQPPIEGHEDGVFSVAVSPNGKHIVSGSYDKTIRLWDAQTGKAVRGPSVGHKDGVTSVVYSPDGKRIVSGSYDKTIRLWDAQTGEPLLPPIQGHGDGVLSVAFSPDGKRIASGSLDKTIRLWNAETGVLMRPPLMGHEGWVFCAAFSSDGKHVVSGSFDGTIRLWDAETGDPIHPPLEGHKDGVLSIAFSPDGKKIAMGPYNKTIQLWDANIRELEQPPLEGHTHWIFSTVFSPDGKYIASGSGDGTIRLWDTETGELVQPPLEGHEDGILSVIFSLDGKRIASGSNDKTICLWDAQTGVLMQPPLVGHDGSVSSVAFSPDGKCIASGSTDKTIRLWDIQTGKLVRPPFCGHEDPVNSVMFSSDGKHIVSGSYDKTIRLWDARTGELVLSPLVGHEDGVLSVSFSPDSKYIVSGSYDKTIRLWDAQTGELVQPPLLGHKEWVHSVAFSPDGKYVVSGSSDETIRLWDAQTGVLVQPPFEGHEGRVTSVNFSLDGKRIVSGSYDKTIWLWDTETQPRGQCMIRFSAQLEHALICPTQLAGQTLSPSHYWSGGLVKVSSEGWVQFEPKTNLLFWAPPTYHLRQYCPSTLKIIPSPRIQLDFSHMAHGNLWDLCYRRENA